MEIREENRALNVDDRVEYEKNNPTKSNNRIDKIIILYFILF